MNPGGVVEETGSTIRTMIDALKGSPTLLFMLLSNVALLCFVWYSQISNNTLWIEENRQRAENAKTFAEKTVDCVPSSIVRSMMNRGFKLQSDDDDDRPARLPPIRPLPKE